MPKLATRHRMLWLDPHPQAELLRVISLKHEANMQEES